MNKFVIMLLMAFALMSCEPSVKNSELINGTAILIGYKVAKHSHMYIMIEETGTTHDIGSLGGRREPVMSLGDRFPIQYYIIGSRIIPYFNRYKYVKDPTNRNSRKVTLPGYEKYCY